MLSTVNIYYQQGGAWGDQFFLSTNGGSSWTNVVARGFTLNNNGVPWLTSSQSIHWAGSIEFDPFSTSKVWITSGNGIFRNDAIETSGTWSAMVSGLEETVPLDMVSIPGGPIMSSIGDYDGFKQSDPAIYGTQHSPSIGTTSGIAYASKNISKIVRVGASMQYSTNQGTSWTQTAKMPTTSSSQGYVSLSTTGNRILYSPSGVNKIYYSTNNGSTWKAATGISFNARPVSDYETDNRFFAYNSSDGFLYYSTNGTSFSKGAYTGASGGSQHIRTAPGFTGHVWVALYGGGLAYTTNGTSTSTAFIKLSSVTACSAVGFGKTATGATYPTVYIWGTIGGVEGVYRSINQGASWTRINDDAHEWGGPGNGQFVIGDMNIYGRVYISTAGRGIAYIESAGVARTAPVLTNIPEINPELNMATYPNPVSDQLTVQLTEEMKGSTVSLTNINGQKVYLALANSSNLKINMAKMPTGIYVLAIVNKEKSTAIKVVKE
jgi:hypothetical protein